MLYRNNRPLAFGHGVSVNWNKQNTVITSSFMPTYEVAPIDKECKNFRCKDACIRSKCAYNALCTATDHKAICTCPDESTGNPYEECIAITTSKTQKDFAVKRNLLVSRWRSRFAGGWNEV